MGASLFATMIPYIPAMLIIFAAALTYAWSTHFTVVGGATLIVLGAITVFSFIVDNIAALYGVKKAGGSKAGIVGAMLGGLAGGVAASLPGLVIGTFLGAVLGELITGKKVEHSVNVGVGTLIGLLASTFIRFVLALVMIVIFVVSVFIR